MFNQKVMQAFLSAKNYGIIKNYDAVGLETDDLCGDIMKIYLSISDSKILDAKFKVFGGVSSIASAEILTSMVKDMYIDDAKLITDVNILNELDGLPVENQYSALLSVEALHNAFMDYEKKLQKNK